MFITGSAYCTSATVPEAVSSTSRFRPIVCGRMDVDLTREHQGKMATSLSSSGVGMTQDRCSCGTPSASAKTTSGKDVRVDKAI